MFLLQIFWKFSVKNSLWKYFKYFLGLNVVRLQGRVNGQ